MTATPRLYSITWGSTTVPGSVGGARAELHGIHELEVGYRSTSVSFSVVVHHQTEATFRAGCAALEAAFRTPRQALTVALPGGNTLALTHAGNTILDGEATISKPGSPVDTARSRLYVVTIVGGRPADLSGQSGLRDFSWRLVDRPAVSSLFAQGEYTAIGGTQARAQYLASIDTRVGLITTALGGTWQLLADDHSPGDTDQVVRFEREYRRTTYNEASGTLDHAALRNQALSVDRTRVSVAGASTARPLVQLDLAYRVEVVRTEVDDGSGVVDPSLVLALWEDTVRPHLLEQLEEVAGGTAYVVAERPGLSLDPPGFVAAMQALALDGGGNVLRKTTVVEDDVGSGALVARTWPGTTPKPRASEPTPGYVSQGPRVIVRRVTQVVRSAGGPAQAPLGEGFLDVPDPAARGVLVLDGWRTRFEETYEGLADGSQLRVTDKVSTATWQLLGKPEARGAA